MERLRGALVAILAVLAAASSVSGQCTLPFDIDAGTSAFAGGGVVTRPLRANISVNSSSGAMSLTGRLFLSLSGACPSTAADVLTSLHGAELAFPANAPPVRISPRVLRAQVRDRSPPPLIDEHTDATCLMVCQAAAVRRRRQRSAAACRFSAGCCGRARWGGGC